MLVISLLAGVISLLVFGPLLVVTHQKYGALILIGYVMSWLWLLKIGMRKFL